MNAYILLDRTGSMQTIWAEALGSVNAYVKELGGDETDDTRVTLACFDHQERLQFDVLRRDVTAKTFRPITDADATPRGMTPLFDAIGRMVALAEADAPDKAVFVVMTDGAENASQEVTRDGAKAALDRARQKGWQVVFLGANFDAFGEADRVGVAAAQTLNAAPGRLGASMRFMAMKSKAYKKTGEAMKFNEQERKEAGFDDRA